MTESPSTQTVKRVLLPIGCADRVAASVGVSASYVRLILQGKRSLRTDKAKAIMIELAKELKEEALKIRKITNQQNA